MPVRTPPTRVLVVRHGRSVWNAEGRWQGHADIPLDDEGQRQAAAAAEVLGGFDAIWASDLQRARLTAQIIAELHGTGPVLVDARLRETDVGPWEGLRHDEVEAGWPGFLAERRRPEGFEEYGDAARRALAALVDIAAAHRSSEVLVVSHGGIIRALRRELEAADPMVPNLGGSWFHIHHDDRVEAGELVHLLDPPSAATGRGGLSGEVL